MKVQLHPHRQGALRGAAGPERSGPRAWRAMLLGVDPACDDDGVAAGVSAIMTPSRSAGLGRQSDPDPGTGVQVIVTVHLVAVSVLVDGPVSSRPSAWLVPCTA